MRILSSFLLIAAFAVASVFATTPANVAGQWNVLVNAGGQQIPVAFALTQKDDAFTGTTTSDLGDGTIEQGRVNGSDFTGLMKGNLQGQPVDIKLSGKIDGDKMTGNMDIPGFGSLPFAGTRKK
jgi:hypothetical protein